MLTKILLAILFLIAFIVPPMAFFYYGMSNTKYTKSRKLPPYK